jgi:hypothetical protein
MVGSVARWGAYVNTNELRHQQLYGALFYVSAITQMLIKLFSPLTSLSLSPLPFRNVVYWKCEPTVRYWKHTYRQISFGWCVFCELEQDKGLVTLKKNKKKRQEV